LISNNVEVTAIPTAVLPRIIIVDQFGEQVVDPMRRPVGVVTDHWPQIRPLDRKTVAEVHLIRLDDAAIGIV
jgi:hypothetical protein